MGDELIVTGFHLNGRKTQVWDSDSNMKSLLAVHLWRRRYRYNRLLADIVWSQLPNDDLSSNVIEKQIIGTEERNEAHPYQNHLRRQEKWSHPTDMVEGQVHNITEIENVQQHTSEPKVKKSAARLTRPALSFRRHETKDRRYGGRACWYDKKDERFSKAEVRTKSAAFANTPLHAMATEWLDHRTVAGHQQPMRAQNTESIFSSFKR
ncbi:unnamed protein product [Darwinula stevensoni]|uniref:Uncharacterized protein n=1 Tax=Darwinula stevensoni TaxID=69355 RepID=A0A7R9A9V0_9CRUS|nr:unnamed protein product [Darwinula stevensoni]CAG0897564.1 unnamed protein product [Darwinula stevensoni]